MIKYPDPVRRRIDWHLDASRPNNFFTENAGYWQVDPAEGGSLVTYAIAVRTILPGFATRGAERESLVDTIKKLRKLVEDEKGAVPWLLGKCGTSEYASYVKRPTGGAPPAAPPQPGPRPTPFVRATL